jgi:hypothetical protein
VTARHQGEGNVVLDRAKRSWSSKKQCEYERLTPHLGSGACIGQVGSEWTERSRSNQNGRSIRQGIGTAQSG